MGAYKYIEALWKKKQSDVMRFLLRIRCWEYRHKPAVHRCTQSSRPEKARRLGFHKKQGFVIYRTRIRRGDRKRRAHKGIVYGKPVHHGIHKQKAKVNLQARAEQRVGRKIPSLSVLNSYWVGQDGTYKFYEVIMIDRAHPVIRSDPKINWICHKKRRECRGLTSAGRKHRGLRVKGRRDNKVRPSRSANWKRRQTISLKRFR
eukprot:Filipodium_phascolosomae@DN1867_c0_g1_i1.p2